MINAIIKGREKSKLKLKQGLSSLHFPNGVIEIWLPSSRIISLDPFFLFLWTHLYIKKKTGGKDIEKSN
jgi:hypothetical protein